MKRTHGLEESFDNDAPVGFEMLELDVEKADYYLRRYMIAEEYQGKRFGKAALLLVVDMVKG